MHDLAKIHLSKEEKELIKNTEWIFSKRLILKKAEHLLTGLQQEYQNSLFTQLSHAGHPLFAQRNKISRGENYKGLPYLILDYPAIFKKNGVLAVRTMFWWGKYFSSQLHISGEFMPGEEKMREWIYFFSSNNFFININSKEWEHHFEQCNFALPKTLTEAQIQNILKKQFFKAGIKTGLENWEEVTPALVNAMKVYREFLQINFLPNDETSL